MDVAFIRTRVSDTEGLVVILLLEESMLAALPRGHALAAGHRSLPLKSLAGETFVVYRRPSGPGLYDAIIAACHAAGFSPNVGQEAPRIISTFNLVAAGLGVSLVPASLQRMHMNDVAYRRLRDAAQPRAPLLLATRRGDGSAVVQRFVKLVRRMAREFATGGARAAG